MSDVTRILTAIEQGDAKEADKLLPLVYEELRRLAAHKMSRESPGQTLQATALVHEAYLRLINEKSYDWDSRTRFFTAAAEAMRRILIENARHKNSQRRGGEWCRVEYQEELAISELSEDILVLDEALSELEQMDSVKADLVRLRYFAGLTFSQIAKALNLSEATAKRHLRYARAWLYNRISTIKQV